MSSQLPDPKGRGFSRKIDEDVLEFKINQAVGSMALDGVSVSDETKKIMTEILKGNLSGENERKKLVKKFSKKP